MFPHEISGELEKHIRAGLLRIEAEGLGRRSHLERAYDVYAMELSRAEWLLTETLLTESIPSWVCQWAKPWLPTKRQVPGWMDLGKAWAGSLPGRVMVPATRPLSEAEQQAWVRGQVWKRIKYWQAEALSPEAGAERGAETLSSQAGAERDHERAELESELRSLVARLLECDVNVTAIAVLSSARSSFFTWKENPGSVLDSTVFTMVLHLREAVKNLPPQSK
jgi:hypothetical protein